jgi:SPP1 family phage portal protein
VQIILSVQEIQTLITNDIGCEKKRLAKVGQRYYEAEHDIREYKVFYFNDDGELVEDRAKSNQKISHPFFTELVDQLVSYVLSNDEEIIKSDADGLQEHLNVYFDEEFWAECAELLTGTYAKGFDYLYAYKHRDDRTAFQYADCIGVVEVREKDTDDGCACTIYWYTDRIEKGKKEIRRIQVHTDKDITYYMQDGVGGEIVLDDNVPMNPCPNVIMTDTKTGKKYAGSLGFIPFFRLDYNRKQISGLKPIKALIDDYDLMECGLSNNLQDFDHPIYAVKGFEGDDLSELGQNLRTKKMVGVGENGGIDIMTINVPYQARKTKADEDEKNIYRFGMGLNTSGLKDTSATTNLAIQAAYTLLDLKAKKLITRFKRFLKDILEIVIAEINEKNKTGYSVNDVYFDFTPHVLVNESETASTEQIKAATKQLEVNTILNVAEYIGDDETLKSICEVLDLDHDEISDNLTDETEVVSLDDAQDALDAVEPEEDVGEESGISEGEQQTQQAVLGMLDELLKELD